MNKNISKVRLHDGIVGILYLSSVLLANYISLSFGWIAIAVGWTANRKSFYQILSCLFRIE